jgi:hypothetical protein
MFGLKPDPDEADRLIEKWSAQHELRSEVFLLVLPGAIGLYLLVNGIADGAYLEVAVGLLLVACTPILARRLIRKSKFGNSDD